MAGITIDIGTDRARWRPMFAEPGSSRCEHCPIVYTTATATISADVLTSN
jgi:hypothetical protein